MNTLAACGLEELFFSCFRKVPPAHVQECLLGFFILEKQLASQGVFLVRSELFITAYLFFVFNSLSAMDGRDRPLKN
jgi:hypothetical protein